MHFGRCGFGGGGDCGRGCTSHGLRRWQWVGQGFDPRDLVSGDVLVVVVAVQVEADVGGVEGFVTDAVDGETVAEGDVLERMRGWGHRCREKGGGEGPAAGFGQARHSYETTTGAAWEAHHCGLPRPNWDAAPARSLAG